MDTEKIESFLALAKIGNFARAADSLFISQPALSNRIRSIENELGAPLFNRMGNHTYLTEQGEYFKPFAEQMLYSYYNSKEFIHQMYSLEHGVLRFGATNFIGVYLIPQLLKEYKTLYPNIDINLTINTSRNILEMLEKNQFEFVLLSSYILNDTNAYDIVDCFEDHLKVIVGNEHPLFGKEHCSLEDIKNDVYITKGPKSSQHKFLTDQGIIFENQLFISNQEAIKECVIKNIGISIMSEQAVERDIAGGSLSALSLNEADLCRHIQLVRQKNRHITPAAQAFIDIIKA